MCSPIRQKYGEDKWGPLEIVTKLIGKVRKTPGKSSWEPFSKIHFLNRCRSENEKYKYTLLTVHSRIDSFTCTYYPWMEFKCWALDLRCVIHARHSSAGSQTCTATAIPFIYSFSGMSAALAPISTFMCFWAIYIFPRSVYIFPPTDQADPSWKYIIRSQTHECGNWDWGPDIPFLGIFVSHFRHFVFAVCGAFLTRHSMARSI